MRTVPLVTSILATSLAAQAQQGQDPAPAAAHGKRLIFKGQLPSTPVAGIEPSSPTASLKSDDTADVILSVFDQPISGTLVFEERQKVTLMGQNFVTFLGAVTPGGFPANLLTSDRSLWVEVKRVSAPQQPIPQPTGTRMLLVVLADKIIPPNPNFAGIQAASLCFTCGGDYPFFAGSIGSSFGGINNAAFELGPGCDASNGYTTDFNDTQPFLCVK